MFLSACLLAALPAAPAEHSATAVAPTADGKLLFVAVNGAPADTGRVCVWDLAKPELKAVVTGTPSDVRVIRPTADGARFVLIAGDEYRTARAEVWDAVAKKRLHALDVSAKEYGRAVASPGGDWVAYRTHGEKAAVRVWNAETGTRADELEKALAKAGGTLAFTADGKWLIALTEKEYAEYDPATGKAVKTWARGEGPWRAGLDRWGGAWVEPLPKGKGVVTVAATAKRRQSYVVHLATEKKDHFLGEFWDEASAPIVSPDGRLLIVSGGRQPDGGGTFALKLDADGAPELEDAPKNPVGPFVRMVPGAADAKVPAWRAWGGVGEATRAGREMPGALAFAGERLFVGGRLGQVQVHDAARRTPAATLFAARPTKDELPAWHIVTAAGECVGSAAEVEALTKAGKVADAAKVRAALGAR